MTEGERRIFTVSELTMRLKAAIEETFPGVWVEGEISNLRT
ncbi:MAG: OB-fold nucleic acid binding domain, partial [Candidatus Rokubacteria bacterium]|nr:OB-fold nucleic acid binding domain [Candidatus Rokubacteria bacterium]